jgi:hypothetical protein
LSAVATPAAKQKRLGMFLGVAVGFQLAHELLDAGDDHPDGGDRSPGAGEPREEN